MADKMPERGGWARSLDWILWWRIDHGECQRQALEYDYVPLLWSARGAAVGCIAISVFTTLFLVVLNVNDTDAWALVDVAVMAIIGLYIARGHRWAMLVAMAFWTLEKVGGIGEVLHAGRGAMAVAQLVWWAIFMHAFWFAFRVERAHRQHLKATGEVLGAGYIAAHAAGTFALFFVLVAILGAGCVAFFFSSLDFYRYGLIGGYQNALTLRGAVSKPFNTRFVMLTAIKGEAAATYTFELGQWVVLSAIWREVSQTNADEKLLPGNVADHVTGSSVTLVPGNGVRFMVRDGSGCVTYDLKPDRYAEFDAALLNAKSHFGDHPTAEIWSANRWQLARAMVRGYFGFLSGAECRVA